MPLIDITLNRRYSMRIGNGGKNDFWSAATHTNFMVKRVFAPALPALLVTHAQELGLEADTPPEGVQVMNHDYGQDDVNIANIWIRIQFSEDQPEPEERIRIRDRLYSLIMKWFHDQLCQPENLVIDLFWGPTNGKGMVKGVEIAW